MSAELTIIPPILITDDFLVSSTATEDEHGEYNPATTYAADEKVISTVTHRIYRSALSGNVGKDPTDLNNQFGTTVYWIDEGPTNRHAMFDGIVSTATKVASPLTVVVRPEFFDALYLDGLDADAYELTIRDAPGGNIIYYAAEDLEGSAPDDYWEYFYEPFEPLTELLVLNIEPYFAAEITLTLTKASGLVSCGLFAVGPQKPLGFAEFQAAVEPKSYSFIDINDRGDLQIIKGKATTDMRITSVLDNSAANRILKDVQEALDLPCVVIGTDLPQYGGLRVYGLISGVLTYENPKQSKLDITVKGLK